MQQFRALISQRAPCSLARLSGLRTAAAGSVPLYNRALASKTPLYATNGCMHSLMRGISSEALSREPPSEDLYNEASLDSAPAQDEYVPVPFRSYKNVDPETMRAITNVLKFETASKVQDQIISRMPIKGDIMVKAKTGTGKTIAFLISAIEAIRREYAQSPDRKRKGRSIGCLIISPTRELAKQIATEAEKLVKFQGWGVQLVVGGENIDRQLAGLSRMRSDIVIGTPGRVVDFLQNQELFKEQASATKVLIFDEADMMLDMGFRAEVDKIIEHMPTDRQSFLVSATIDKKVKALASKLLSRDVEEIDCVGKDDVNTHANVKQEYIQAEFSQHLPLMSDMIHSHIARNKAEGRGAKIVVFLPTVKAADFYGNVLRNMLSKNAPSEDMARNRSRAPRFGSRGRNTFDDVVSLYVLHGKLSQHTRTRRSDIFRKFPVNAGSASILVTTDVSARGVDYPDVSMVIQAGIPSETPAYIHRLGRTGRAGKSGEGVILLSPLEMPFLKEIKDVPITESETYNPEYIQKVCNFETDSGKQFATRWTRVLERLDPEQASAAYVSLVAFFTASKDLICDPPGKMIVDGTKDILKPFDLPLPPLPRGLHMQLSSPGSNRGGYGNSRRQSNGFNRDNNRPRDGGYNRFNTSREGGDNYQGGGYSSRGGYERNNRNDRENRGERQSWMGRGRNDRGSWNDRGGRDGQNSGFSRSDRGSSRGGSRY
ncbi:hypothetical protein H4S08_003679 [Coemansia sp. RSA 1365]|nr:hypothetical protein H4S08_003679 [Coemansia sp. RSA 1365]